jgi:hypothetical protein
MEEAAKPGLTDEVAAALDWWREAGVDAVFADAPTQWIAAEETRPSPAAERRAAVPSPAPTPAPPAVDRAAWPQDLTAFTEWWLTNPALDDGRTSGRVAPRGAAGAACMILVPEPERDDTDLLLSGPQGRLLNAMLAAMGIAPENAYVASVLPRHTPMPDWGALAAKGIGALLCHHVKLVGPQRLIALGSNILPLLGNDPAHSPAVLSTFNQEGRSVPLLAGKSLAALLERPRWKAGLWQGWLDWSK